MTPSMLSVNKMYMYVVNDVDVVYTNVCVLKYMCLVYCGSLVTYSAATH